MYAIVSAHHLNPIQLVMWLPYIGPTVCPSPSMKVNTPEEMSVASIFCFGKAFTESLIITGKQVIKKKFANIPFRNWPTHIMITLSGRNTVGPTRKLTIPHISMQLTIRVLLSNLSVNHEIVKLVKVYITPYIQKNNPTSTDVKSKSSSLIDITGSI